MIITIEQAKLIRPLIEKAMQFLGEKEALKCKTMYPHWSKLVELGSVDTNGEPGYRFYYNNELYKCVNPNPTFQADWVPGLNTSALYVRIDESASGTITDPITAARGMEYIYGKYYLDPEDGKIYKCQRTGEADGNTIVLAYLPHELVGLYFVEATQ